MPGAIGDINQGLTGISHTSGTSGTDMPVKDMAKPSSGSTIEVHTTSVLNLEDSSSHLMKFIRGDNLEAYSPQEQKEFRQDVLNAIEELKNSPESSIEDKGMEQLKAMELLLKRDEELETMATMARNVLLSA